MPEITVLHIAIIALSAAVAAIIAWVIRGQRSIHEKTAINASWHERIDRHNNEQQRLIDQNKDLMGQISHLQASSQDARNRARELSVAAREASARRDDLQREIKDIRSNLEVVLTQRDQLQSDIATKTDSQESSRQKDEKIFQLSRELENWHKRLPPLIERYRVRNAEAEQLESDLAAARLRIEQLESMRNENPTCIEPVRDPDTLTDGRGASNDSSDRPPLQPSAAAEPAESHPETILRDNLQAIRGVGPSIEQTLNELGIFRFQQIADMSEYDIDRVATRLKGFHSRIYRENWIGQARELSDRSKNV